MAMLNNQMVIQPYCQSHPLFVLVVLSSFSTVLRRPSLPVHHRPSRGPIGGTARPIHGNSEAWRWTQIGESFIAQFLCVFSDMKTNMNCMRMKTTSSAMNCIFLTWSELMGSFGSLKEWAFRPNLKFQMTSTKWWFYPRGHQNSTQR